MIKQFLKFLDFLNGVSGGFWLFHSPWHQAAVDEPFPELQIEQGPQWLGARNQAALLVLTCFELSKYLYQGCKPASTFILYNSFLSFHSVSVCR